MKREYDINKCTRCGSNGVIKGRKKIRVVCMSCGQQGAVKPFTSQAVDAWNSSNKSCGDEDN